MSEPRSGDATDAAIIADAASRQRTAEAVTQELAGADLDQKSAALNEKINAQLADIKLRIDLVMAENFRLQAALRLAVETLKAYAAAAGPEGSLAQWTLDELAGKGNQAAPIQ